MIATGVICSVLLLYASWIAWLGGYGLRSASLPSKELGGNKLLTATDKQQDALTVVVAHRGEANVQQLARLLAAQEGALVRTLFVDDRIEGQQADVYNYAAAENWIENNGQRGKKYALGVGMGYVDTQFTAFTDADTVPGKMWAATLLAQQKTIGADCVLAPLQLTGKRGIWLELLQVEYASIMAVTAAFAKRGNPIMANGANMLCRTHLWKEADTARTDHAIPSGDDAFLLAWLKKEGHRIAWADQPEAVVITEAPVNLTTFFAQRIRWAGKWQAVPDPLMQRVALWTFLFHLFTLLAFPFTVSTPLVGPVFLVLKVLPEWWLLKKVSKQIGQPFSFRGFALLQILYPVYVVGVGLWATLFGRGGWKT
jgi:poly-beta-1,6-N-acetyl-D-glucosamine synthase